MDAQSKNLEQLRHIKNMMERSSRFISLSGLSGISAGVCALIGAWLAVQTISGYVHEQNITAEQLVSKLVLLAGSVFIAALVFAFIFTYLRTKKNGVAMWSATTYRMLANLSIPLIAGGVFVLRLIALKDYQFVASACLIFYGLALTNVAKYTLGEIRYLGYFELLLGIINLWIPGYSIIFWAFGFGVLHIIYGCIMWWKYERV